MKRLFTKPALTVSDQVALLQNKGMIIADAQAAEKLLACLGYYHLSAYWFPYKTGTGRFKANTDFSEITKLYEFDRSLKAIIAAALERIEIAVKASLVSRISNQYGAHGWLNWQIYEDCAPLAQLMRDTLKAFARPNNANNQFTKHYADNYTPSLPPLWIAAELFSFGATSKFLKALKSPQDRNAVAQLYGLDEQIFSKALQHLVVIRNICAHHGRLWNRKLPFAVPAPTSQIARDLQQSLNAAAKDKIYNTLCYINYLLRSITPQTNWRQDIISLITQRRPIYAPLAAMGFAADWQSRPLWQ